MRNSSLAIDTNNNVYATYWNLVAKYSQTIVTAPAARILLPLDNTVLKYPADIFINATATELPSAMQFWDGTAKIGEATASPFILDWKNVPGGNHELTATFTNGSGTVITSPPVHITIITNIWPSVSIVSPTNGAYFIAPAKVTISAQALDPDGSVTAVNFFAGNPLGQVTTPPYSLTFSNVPSGQYSLTATATDNEGAIGSSAPVRITVIPSNSPPIITAQLANATGFAGTNFHWTVPVFGPSPLYSQWQFNGTNLPGKTNTTLALTNLQGAQAGTYTLVVSNQYGQATTSAKFTVVSQGLLISDVRLVDGGRVQLTVSVRFGVDFAVETSTNFVDWTVLERIATTNQIRVFDYTIEPNRRFYRLSKP